MTVGRLCLRRLRREIVRNYGGFSHVLRFSSFDPTNSLMTFVDDTGATVNVYNTSATGATLIVDGNSYAINITDVTNKKIKMDLNRDGYLANETTAAPGMTAGTGPADTQAGVAYSYLVPKLISSGQGGLYFYKGSSGATNVSGTWIYPQLGFAGIRWVINGAATTLTVATKDATGSGWTNETALTLVGDNLIASGTYTKNYVDYFVQCLNSTGNVNYICTASLGTTNATNYTYPGFILVEEALEGSTTHNWNYFPVNYSSTYIRAVVGTPISDDANFGTPESVIGTTGLYKDMDSYGTYVEYDTTAGSATLKYPDTFSYANVYVLGPGGTITTGGATGEVTTETVLPINWDIVKLDSEITSTDKTTKDLVLVGGPCVNTLVADLATAGSFPYTCAGWPGRNFGRVQVISGGFATGYTVAVIAGTRAADTDLAARVVQEGFTGASSTQKAGSYLEITGSVTSPAYST